MATDIAHLIASAEWHGDSAERGLDRLDTKFNKTEKSAQQFGQKITQVGNESNQSTGKIDQAGKAVNSTGDKMERAGKQVGNLSDRLRDSRGKFVSAGQGASEFTGKIKSVDSASESAGSRIGALISKITGFNRASREMGSGGGRSTDGYVRKNSWLFFWHWFLMCASAQWLREARASRAIFRLSSTFLSIRQPERLLFLPARAREQLDR